MVDTLIYEIKEHLSNEDKKLLNFLFSLTAVKILVERIYKAKNIGDYKKFAELYSYDIFCGLTTLNFSFVKIDRISAQVKMRNGVDVFISFKDVNYSIFMLTNFKKYIDDKKVVLAKDIRDLKVTGSFMYTLKVSANDVLWSKVPEIFQDVVIDNLT